MWDVAIVGAGMAGLICGRSLQAAGYRVGILEKSRGFGGRMATRRHNQTHADHGVSDIEPNSGEALLTDLVETLQANGLLTLWPHHRYDLNADGKRQPVTYGDRAVAPLGMNQIGKFLSAELKIYRQQRVVGLNLLPQNKDQKTWQVSCQAPDDVAPCIAEAKALVLAIPAPQALTLLEPLATLGEIESDGLETIRAVRYDACLTVIAGYGRDLDLTHLPDSPPPPPHGWVMQSEDHSILRWVGLDSSKRQQSPQPVVVVHSSAQFAERFIDSPDLTPIGTRLLKAAADVTRPELANPDWFQVHRWRYARVNQPLTKTYLRLPLPWPLLCCGDWCGGQSIGAALNSGMATATAVNRMLNCKTLPSPQTLWRGQA